MDKIGTLLPRTLFGRALFLLFLAQAFFWFACLPLLSAWGLLRALCGGDVFRLSLSRGDWAVCLARFFGGLLSEFAMSLSNALACAAIWLVVYCVFRLMRNADLGGRQFFFISALTTALVCLPPVCLTFDAAMLALGAFSLAAGYFLFLKEPLSPAEPPADYLKRLLKTLCHSRLFWALIFAWLLLRFAAFAVIM